MGRTRPGPRFMSPYNGYIMDISWLYHGYITGMSQPGPRFTSPRAEGGALGVAGTAGIEPAPPARKEQGYAALANQARGGGASRAPGPFLYY